MTIGIYKLEFSGTDKVYIGQSIDINSRFIQHKSAMRLGTAAPKLQEAYNTYGYPTITILLEGESKELNSMEDEAITVFDSVLNGFNSLKESGPPMLYGENAGQAKESNEVYLWILELLVSTPSLSKREIENITGVSIYTIRHIAALESHCWLKEVSPENYEKLIRIKHDKPYYYGTAYPKLLSPDGIVYEVGHMTNFSKEHGLLQPKVSEVLKGTRKSHKGWTKVAA